MNQSKAQIRHDLKNPLAAMKGYAQLLESKLKSAGRKSDQLLASKIDDQIDKLIELIDRLLKD